MELLKAWFEGSGFKTVKEGMEQLEQELGIKVKEYAAEGLYVFNYSQIDSPKTNPIVMECRGLILTNDFEVVCRPFDRFFNYGEALEVTGDFSFESSVVCSKEDGSLVKVYFWDGDWRVATRGTAFAESENYTGEVFQNLILDAFGVDSLETFSDRCAEVLDTDYTYIFEYTSPKNRVVTQYSEDCMYLLGARNNATGEEIFGPEELEWLAEDLRGIAYFEVQRPKLYKFDSEADMVKFAKGLSDLSEGIVALDPVSGIRLKVKAEFYVQVHHLRGECVPTPKKIRKLIVTNEVEEYLAYFPEDRDLFTPYAIAWSSLLGHADTVFSLHNGLESQKDFALAVKDYSFAWALFEARHKGCMPSDVILGAELRKREKALEQYP